MSTKSVTPKAHFAFHALLILVVATLVAHGSDVSSNVVNPKSLTLRVAVIMDTIPLAYSYDAPNHLWDDAMDNQGEQSAHNHEGHRSRTLSTETNTAHSHMNGEEDHRMETHAQSQIDHSQMNAQHNGPDESNMNSQQNHKEDTHNEQEEENHQPQSHFHNESNQNVTLSMPFLDYQGFQPDLLRQLIHIAKALDNVTLSFEMEEAPALSHEDYFDRVSKDCVEDCDTYDLIVGDFYGTPDRSIRAHLTPPLLNTAAAALKYIHSHNQQVSTVAEAEAMNATVCVQEGTHWGREAQKLFPHLQTTVCADQDECISMLKHHQCALWLGDELQLRYITVHDPDIQVKHEHFHKRMIVWPMNARLDPISQNLIVRWIYEAHVSGAVDHLYHEYFEVAHCPRGKSGIHCDEPCSATNGVSDRYGNCICDSTRWTGDDCSIEVAEDRNLIEDSPLRIMCYIMIGINVFIIAVCAIWLVWNRKEAPVKVAQPLFLGLVLLGCLISTSTIFALSQEDSGASMEHTMHIGTHANHEAIDHGHGEAHLPACMAIPWLYSVGFSITFGSLFAKIRRVYLLFKAAVTMQRVAMTTKETFLIVGGVLLIDVVILTVWTVVDPLTWQRQAISVDKYGHPLSSEGYCTSDHFSIFAGIIASFHFSIMSLACYLCYVSRDIPTKFSEGKYVAIAMISNIQIFVVSVPILILLGTESQTSFFVRSVVIWMNDLAIVALIFGNLMYSVHSSGRLRRESSKVMVRNAMKSFTRRTKEREASEHSDSMLSSTMHSLASKWHGSKFSVQRPSMSSDVPPDVCKDHDFLLKGAGTRAHQTCGHHRGSAALCLDPVFEQLVTETEQHNPSSRSFFCDDPDVPNPEAPSNGDSPAFDESRFNPLASSHAPVGSEDEFQQEHSFNERRPAIHPQPDASTRTNPKPQHTGDEEARQSLPTKIKSKRVSWMSDEVLSFDTEISV